MSRWAIAAWASRTLAFDNVNFLTPLRPRGLEPGQGAFTDQRTLELGQRREDAEHGPAGRGGGVDLRALTGEHPQAHASGGEVLHGLTRWARLRPRRSSFQTTGTSPFLRARKQLSSLDLSCTLEGKSW